MLAKKVEQTQPTQEKAKSYRFDVFKGAVDANGKVHKLKSVGNGYLVEGCKTYTIYLKTFLEDGKKAEPPKK